MAKKNFSTISRVVEHGLCTGCGSCAFLLEGDIIHGEQGCTPALSKNHTEHKNYSLAVSACPGNAIDYLDIYSRHYGRNPSNWLTGIVDSCWIGHSAIPEIRRNGSSGGVITHVLCHLLESGLIDAAIIAMQGAPTPESASPVIASTVDAIKANSQSVYIPVPMLKILSQTQEGQSYAITCLPDQAASLRKMQLEGVKEALRIKYILGPYTGTALEPGAIRALLRSHRVPSNDKVRSIKWRAGEWPGYLELVLMSGRVIRSKKIYYNYLIPFYITESSLTSIDFVNEFADLSVGDAWSPKYEGIGGGYSVVTSRSKPMSDILKQMAASGLLMLSPQDPLEATSMHGHMIDFKKRGSFIRNSMRSLFGRNTPFYGIAPTKIPSSRYIVEIIISLIFTCSRTKLARYILTLMPEPMLGPIFNNARLGWKSLSKPTKRKGLARLDFKKVNPSK